MFSLRNLVILFYLTLVVLASAFSVPTNTTVDHDDPSVTYSGNWEQVVVDEDVDSPSCTHRLSSHDPSAYALVTFRGTAVYVISPKWPYRVAATMSIDGGNPIQLDLQDHSVESDDLGPTIPAHVVAHQRGLDPSVEHTVRFFTQPGEPCRVLHDVLYTSSEDPYGAPAPSPSAAAAPTMGPQVATAMGSQIALTMGIGIGVGTSGFLALVLLLIRRRRRSASSPKILRLHPSDILPSTPSSPKAFSLNQPLSSPWELPMFIQQPAPSRTTTPRTPSFSVRAEPLPPSFAVTCPPWDAHNRVELPATMQSSDPRKLHLDIPPAYRTRFSSGPEGMTSPITSPAPRYSTLPFTLNRPQSTAKLVLTYNRRTSTDSL